MKRILLLCLTAVFTIASSELYAQERTITGKVTSMEDGTPLPGVNVVLKGTANGAVTDVEGNYTLSVPQAGGTLVFTFIGLRSEEVEIGARTSVDLQMAQDVQQLSEVVVTALGLEQNRDEIGSASSQVRGESIQKSGEATLINGLSGKASGVNIVRSSGDPGAGSYIQIRGQSTITGSLQPLIVLDGVPINNNTVGNIVDGVMSGVDGVVQQSRLNDLNPDDIASVEILKGASAGALWGTRAANGVIVITTKKGNSGKGKVNVSFKSTYSQDRIYLTHDLTKNWGSGTNMQYRQTPPSGYSWGDYIPERSGEADAYITDPSATGYAGVFEAPDGTRIYAIAPGTAAAPHGGKNSRETFDYRDYLFKNGSYWDNSLSISGGDKDDNFYLSVSNLDQDGILRFNSNYKRTTFRINANKRYNDVLRMGTNFSYSRVSSDRVQTGSNTSGLYLGGLRTSPDFNSEIYEGTYTNAAGQIFFNRQRSYRNPLGASVSSVYDNPLWMMKHNLSTSQVDRFIGMAEAVVTPVKWLDVTARLGIDSYGDRRKDFFDPLSSAFPDGYLSLNTIRETQINGDLFGQGKFTLGDGFTLNAILGMNLNHRTFDMAGGTARDFVISTQIPEDLTNAENENANPFNTLSFIRTAATYATADLAIKDMLFINLTGRAESASTFGKDVSSTFFYPSASLAWQFSKMTGESNGFSFGKFRASYGTVGVQPTPYNTRTYFARGAYAESWGPGFSSAAYGGGYGESTTLGNNLLKPERKTEIEVGTDLRFFTDRVSLGATFYTNKTVDAILQVATASSVGFTDKVGNAAEIENKGYELDLGAEIVRAGDFSWRIDGNWSQYRNKVTDLAGTTSLFLAGFTGTSSRAVEGHPLGVLWGVDYLRNDAGDLVLTANGFPQAAPTESVLADPNPDWKAGISTTVRFKGLSLYVLLDHTQGGTMWAGTSGIMNHFGRSKETDVRTTVSATDAAALRRSNGTTIAASYPANSDGSYTFRGRVVDFGGGNVALDQAWYTSLGGGFGAVSTNFMREITNSRIREATLSYSINGAGFRNATKLSSVELSFTGRNLLIWGPDIDVIGNDPETNLTGPTNGRGLEYFNNPATRSYLFSVRITY